MRSSLNNQKPVAFYRSRRLLRHTIWTILFIWGVIGVVSFLFYESYVSHHPVSKDFLKKWIAMAVVSGFALFLMVGFFIKWFQASIKATKPIIFNSDSITIGGDVILFSEINDVKTIGIGYVFYERFFGATVYLLNGESKFIAEQFYKKSPALFQTLEDINQYRISRNGDKNGVQQRLNYETEQKERFDFNIFTSIEHLLMLSLLFMALYGVSKFLFSAEQPPYNAWFFISLIPVVYYLNVRISYHYLIDNCNLEIRNKFLFGFSKVYRLNEIKGIIIHRQGMGRSVRWGTRVVMNDYRTFYFASNAFSGKKWQSFSEALHKRGIYVQNKIS